MLSVFDSKFQDLVKDKVSFLHLEVNDENELKNKREPVDVNPIIQQDNNSLTCSHCQTEFKDSTEQRVHYKSDWHRYNIQQALNSKRPLTFEEYNEKLEKLSSSSSSDASDDEFITEHIFTSHGRIFLKNMDNVILSVYRNLILQKKEDYENVDIVNQLKKYCDKCLCVVFMLGGGRFSGAIFQADTPLKHKTFHSYTVRAGQGGAQGASDNRSAGSHSKSAGSSLRRYNEQALKQHVIDITTLWKEDIEKCDVIFYKASGPYNQSVLFGGKKPILDRLDHRVRSIPVTTRKVTFSEVKRIYKLLTTAYIFETETIMKQWLQTQKQSYPEIRKKSKSKEINRSKSREIIERPDPCQSLSESSCTSSLADLNVDCITLDETIKFEDSLKEYEDTLTPEERKQNKKKPKMKKKARIKEQEEKEKKDLQDLIVQSNIEMLNKYLLEKSDITVNDEQTEEQIPNYELINKVLDNDNSTLLHIAAKHEKTDMVQFLLDNGADPCIKNTKQQTPYTITANKEVRNIFKEFARAHPDKYNYNKANIPLVTLTNEEEEEKKKARRKLKREKQKAKNLENKLKVEEEAQKERFLNLSDREKRALMAEKRILSQGGSVETRCFLCAANITGKVPFEYSNNLFCSVACLKTHRSKNATALPI